MLQRLDRRLAPEGVTVLALSDEPPATIAAFAAGHALPPGAAAIDPKSWLPLGGFRPYTLVVDRAGRLRDHSFGVQDSARLERLARPALSH
jgi:hypothetical protein